MKRRGFTLVELLAVIVILALIALITIPVILNVVEKSKIKTYQRSIDSYGGAVNKAIAEYLLDHEYQTSKTLTYDDIKSYIKYEGNKVECTVNIYSDRTIYLENCKVNGEEVSYTYGVYQEQVYDPGLYDENYNLIASWDDLVSKYGMSSQTSNGIAPRDVFTNNEELVDGKILIISSEISEIKMYMYSGCENLIKVVIPGSVKTIEYSAFSDCQNLQTIIISEGVETIKEGVFNNCTSLKSIVIPSSILNIRTNPFEGCINLETIQVDSNNSIYEDRGANAIIEKSTNTLIVGCKNTIIPNSVASIGDYAFYGISTLKNVIIPNGVVSIGNSAFHSCAGLSSIIIPSSVEHIGAQAFCTKSIKKITFESDSKLTILGNNVFDGTGISTITIPNGVKEIYGAFSFVSSLTSITIPNSVTIIDGTFSGCENLSRVTFESNSKLEKIGQSTFSGCSSLTNITIPISVTRIDRNAFRGSGLVSAVFEHKYWRATTGAPYSGTSLNLSDSVVSAAYLKETYTDRIWEKSI